MNDQHLTPDVKLTTLQKREIVDLIASDCEYKEKFDIATRVFSMLEEISWLARMTICSESEEVYYIPKDASRYNEELRDIRKMILDTRALVE